MRIIVKSKAFKAMKVKTTEHVGKNLGHLVEHIFLIQERPLSQDEIQADMR